MRRVFTKFMGTVSLTSTGGIETAPSAEQWVVEEDVEIIGVDIIAECLYAITVNGAVHGNVELSQAGTQTKDGAIGRVQFVGLQWNAVGQGGGGLGSMEKNKVIMFPPGYSIPVKEEGHVNLHLQLETPAGETAVLYPWCQIYYVKKGK